MTHSDFAPLPTARELKPFERAIIERMSLASSGPIGEALKSQLPLLRAVAECRDGCGSIALTLVDESAFEPLTLDGKLPVDAWIVSADGVTTEIEFLLFARNGRLAELELYRPAGNPQKADPDPSRVEAAPFESRRR